jgi:hypothetical protein
MMDPELYFGKRPVLRTSSLAPIRLAGGCLLYHFPKRHKTPSTMNTRGRGLNSSIHSRTALDLAATEMENPLRVAEEQESLIGNDREQEVLTRADMARSANQARYRG